MMRTQHCRNSYFGKRHAGTCSRIVVSRASSRMVPMETKFPSLFAGRLAVAGGILVFMASYSYGIYQYGWWLGMGLGWLPSSALAWLSAQALAFGMQCMGFDEPGEARHLPGLSLVYAPFCGSDKASMVPRSRRQDR